MSEDELRARIAELERQLEVGGEQWSMMADQYWPLHGKAEAMDVWKERAERAEAETKRLLSEDLPEAVATIEHYRERAQRAEAETETLLHFIEKQGWCLAGGMTTKECSSSVCDCGWEGFFQELKTYKDRRILLHESLGSVSQSLIEAAENTASIEKKSIFLEISRKIDVCLLAEAQHYAQSPPTLDSDDENLAEHMERLQPAITALLASLPAICTTCNSTGIVNQNPCPDCNQ